MRGSITGGLPDTFFIQNQKLPNQQHYLLLTIFDIIFSMVIVAPTVVGYWRSVWELMGYYIYPNDELMSSLISTIIGIIGHLLFTLKQNFFETYINTNYMNRFLYLLLSRFYTIIYAFICVNGWRGPWQLLDLYTTNNLNTIIGTTFVGIIALGTMRALRNCSATPFSVVIDDINGYFEVLTMFRVGMDDRISLYILDCLFSVLVIGTLVVFVWRGGWALFDIYLFPNDEILSAWGSLIVGYTTVIIAFILQPVMKWLCDRLNGIARLLVADFFLIFSLIGTLNVWRGIWNLLNLYLLPDNIELSCWLTHWVCLIILILLGCSNSLLVRGVYIDCQEPDGQCVVFPCYYLRIILKKKQINQSQQQQQQLQQQNKELNEIKGKNKAELLSIKINDTNHILNVVSDELTTTTATTTTTNLENSHYKDKV